MAKIIVYGNQQDAWCIVHQQQFLVTELGRSVSSRGEEVLCPRCIEELGDAKFANTVEDVVYCVIHNGSGVGYTAAEMVARCTGCGQPYCGDCITGAELCIFCSGASYNAS